MRSTIKAVRFISDDQASFVSELGLVLDASPALGAPRAKVYIPLPCFTRLFLSLTYLSIPGCVFSQRFVVIANDDTIETVIVEENASDLTVTEATRVLALL
jgi:peroxiredoxin